MTMGQRFRSGFSVGMPQEAVSIPTWTFRSQSLSRSKSRQPAEYDVREEIQDQLLIRLRGEQRI